MYIAAMLVRGLSGKAFMNGLASQSNIVNGQIRITSISEQKENGTMRQYGRLPLNGLGLFSDVGKTERLMTKKLIWIH